MNARCHRSCGASPAWRRAALLGLASLLGSLDVATVADEPTETPAFRRTFVPAESPESWPRDGLRRLPVDRATWQGYLRSAASEPAGPGASAVQLRGAAYRGALRRDAGKWWLQGTARLAYDLTGETPALASLQPLTLALGEPAWERGAESPEWGLWQAEASRPSTFGVLAQRTDALRFKWRCPATVVSIDGAEFALATPPTVAQTFELDVPSAAELQMSPGLVRRGRIAGEDLVTWHIDMLPGAAHRLRVLMPNALPADPTGARVSVGESYQLRPRGLEYEARLRVGGQPVAEAPLRLGLRGALQALRVAIDGQETVWRYASDARQAILIDLPSSAASSVVTVRGSAALRLGRSWPLPGIRLEPAQWQEGSLAMEVDPRLEVVRLAPADSHLLSGVGIGSPRSVGEIFRLQSWSEKAEIAVELRHREATVVADEYASVEFTQRAQEVVARSTWVLHPAAGGGLAFEADLSPEWTLESVDSQPPDALADWQLVERQGQRRLLGQLRTGPDAAAAVELLAVGRAPLAALPQPLRVEHVDWLRARNCDLQRRLVRIRAEESDVRIVTAMTAAVLGREELRPGEVERLGVVPGGLWIDLQRSDPQTLLALREQAPAYDVRCGTTLTGLGDAFEIRLEILVEPQRGAVQDFALRASRPFPADAKWECQTAAGNVELQCEPADEQDFDGEGWNYRLQLPRALSQAFRIQGVYRTAPQPAAEIPGVDFPRAAAAACWAVLRGHPPQYRVQANDPAQAVVPPEAAEEPYPALACYRLENLPATAAAAIALHRVPEMRRGSTGTTAWRVDAHTTCLPPDRVDVEARYELEIDWGTQIEVGIPAGFELLSARFGEDAAQPLARESAVKTDPQRPLFRLPAGQRRATLTLRLRGTGDLRGFQGVVAPQLPRISAPVAQGSWTVWAPPGYRLALAGARASADDSWFVRLAGEFARGGGPRGSADAPGNAADHPSRPAPEGWQSLAQQFATEPAPVTATDVDRARGWQWLAALGVLATTFPAIRRAPRLAAWATWLAASACLVGPAEARGLAQAVFWGLVAAWAARGVVALRASLAPAAPANASAAALRLVLLLAAAEARSAGAAEPAPLPAVFFPIDRSGKAAGEDVYVPEGLLRTWAAGQSAPAASRGVLLAAAAYELDLAALQPGANPLQSSQTMKFRIHCASADAEVVLPLRRDQAQWFAEQSRLDGGPLTIHWADDGRACRVTIAEPGWHDLQIAFLPHVERTTRGSGFVLNVPPLPGAVATVRRTQEAGSFTVSGIASWENSTGGTRLIGYLPPLEVLDVRWQPARRETSAALFAEQLAWLEIEPARAVLHASLRLTGETLASQRVQLAVDPQLRLLPLPPDSPVQEVETSEERETRIDLKFAPDARLPVEIRLDFQWQRMLSTGRFSFPSIRVEGAQTTRNHFGVSLADNLTYLAEANGDLLEIAPAEFESLSRNLPRRVQLAYAVTRANPRWSLLVRPAAPVLQFRESLRLECRAHHALATWTAEVTAVQGVHQAASVTLPNGVQQCRVSAEDAQGDPVPCRFARSAPAQGALFANRPLEVGDSLRVSAVLDLPSSGELVAPGPAFAARDRGGFELDLRRDLDVDVRWSDPLQAPPSIAEEGPSAPGETTAAVGRYRLDGEKLAAKSLRIIPSPAALSADLACALVENERSAAAVVALHAVVRHGKIDRLNFRLPKDWPQPLAVQPEARLLRRSHPLDADSQLVTVYLPKSFSPGETIDVRLRIPWDSRSGALPVFSGVDLAEDRVRRRFLALPESRGGKPVVWRHSGLREQALPAQLQALLPEAATHAAYAVLQPGFTAELSTDAAAPLTQELRGAWARARYDEDGGWSASLHLLVHPKAPLALRVGLPPGAVLTHAALDGQPSVVADQGAEYRIEVGPPGVPRLLEISYRTQRPLGNLPPPLAAPKFFDGQRPLEGQGVWWEIATPPHARAVADAPGAAAATTAEVSAAIAAEVAAAEQLLQRGRAELPRWERQDEKSWRRTPAWQRFAQPIPQSTAEAAPEERRFAWVQADHGVGFALQRDGSWRSSVACSVAVLALLGSVVVLPLSPLGRRAGELLAAHRWLAVGCLGLAWRLALTPTWPGDFAIAAACLGAWARARRNRTDSSASTALSTLTLPNAS